MLDRDGSYIWPTSLMDAIYYMRENNLYKHIVIYWASDYAAQVFDTLPDDYNVIAIASSGRDEKQELAYCPPYDTLLYYPVGHIGACMATNFGTTWLQ